MAPGAKVKAAFKAMKDIGIAADKTKPALKKLLKLYDNNWDLIEEENYRVLADAIFEYEDDTEAAEKEKRNAPISSNHAMIPEEEASQMQEEPERPLKRLRKHQDPPTSSHGQPNSGSPTCVLRIPKPEPGEPEASPLQQVLPIMASPQSQPLVRNKGKQPMSSQPSSPAVVSDGTKGVSTPQRIPREKRAAPGQLGLDPSGKRKQTGTMALIKPKDEPFTDDMVSLQPLAVVHPESSKQDTPLKSSNSIHSPGGLRPSVPTSADGMRILPPKTADNNVKEADDTDKAPNDSEKEPIDSQESPIDSQEAGIPVMAPIGVEIAASPQGELKLCLSGSPGRKVHNLQLLNLQAVFRKVEQGYIKNNPEFSVSKLMREVCECALDLGTKTDSVLQERPNGEDAGVFHEGDNCNSLSVSNGIGNGESSGNEAGMLDINAPNNTKSLVICQELDADGVGSLYDLSDITRGEEEVKISLDNADCGPLPSFNYIATSVVSDAAAVSFSLAQIRDTDFCTFCSGDCFSFGPSCNCVRRNGGQSPYMPDGLLNEDFLDENLLMVRSPRKQDLSFCKECPLERLKNEDMLDPCKGHLKRRFIKECWTKCGCGKNCGNRVVQRGIKAKLQVFWTPEGKGWGLRTLEDLPKGAFICEYVGEILTIAELHKRNLRRGSEKHSYSVLLDAEWASRAFTEEEFLCLDSTFYGNVARFINHSCSDANLIEIPVEVESPDHHYYHIALFTTRKVDANEELTWDYGVDFDDCENPTKAFRCLCGSSFCRNMKRSSRSRSSLTLR